MKYLALKINATEIPVPSGVPTGGTATLNTILTAFVELLLIVAIVLALFFLVLGGIRWITSGGDPKGVEGARKQLTYAVVGLIIVLLAFFLVSFVGGFFGIKLLGG